MIELKVIIAAAALAVAFVACVTDLRSRRIPNVLTAGAAVAGLLAHAATGGVSGGLTSLAGLVVGMALFLPFFLLGGMGAGDVKLLAALGAWLGPGQVFWLAIYASLIGGVLAVAVAVGRGYLTSALHNIGSLFGYWRVAGLRPLPALTLENRAAPRLAYAVPIFLGTAVTLWLR
jgi:prepilin peptidase CpaA